MTLFKVRQPLKEFIKANPACTEAAIMAEGITMGADEERITSVLIKWIEKGKVIKTGENHSWTE